jgi:spore maturation protein CgeB
LSDDELVKMYSRSHISLGFSEVQHRQTGEIKRHVRLRDFEAPMSGALYFTGYQEELAEYYEIGEEIVCYDTKEELLGKVRYYLSHESEAERMREAGLRRARRDHTWEDRFRQLFEAIGLSHKL